MVFLPQPIKFQVRICNSFSDSLFGINLVYSASSRSAPGQDPHGLAYLGFERIWVCSSCSPDFDGPGRCSLRPGHITPITQLRHCLVPRPPASTSAPQCCGSRGGAHGRQKNPISPVGAPTALLMLCCDVAAITSASENMRHFPFY